MRKAQYIHGTSSEEQKRLARLNALTNAPFLRFLELRETDRALEVGSGLGILAEEVAQRVSKGEVIGLEYAPEQIAQAPKNVPNLHFKQGDAHRMPFEENAFDVAYCRYVLEHVADPLQVLREMQRVLKPGGLAFAQENNILMVAFDPDCPAFDALWRRFVELQKRLGGDALVGKRLFSLFRAAGFEEIALSYQPEIHYAGRESFRPWVENLIGNVEGATARLLQEKLATKAAIHEAISELRALMEREDAAAYFYWNRAKGMKPHA